MGSGYRKKVGSGIKPKEINMPTPKMMKKFQQAGTISTIARPSNAKKFVDIRTRINKLGGYRDGGPVTSKRMTQEKLDRIRKDQIRRNPSDFDLETGARLTEKSKMDRIKKRRNQKTREQLLLQAQGKDPRGLATRRPKKVKKDQKKPKRMALGGEAGESVGRATVEKSQREIRRKEVDDMLDRVYRKKPTIKLKKKPKDPNRIKPKKKPINPKTRKPKGIGFKGKRS